MQQESFPVLRAAIAEAIRAAARPVHINKLTRTAIAAWLAQSPQAHPYAPGNSYQVGDLLLLNGRSATVTGVQPGHNPQQGHFQIISLHLANGRQKLMAAAIAGAPTAEPVTIQEAEIDAQLQQAGLEWRTSVQTALAAKEQFVHFLSEQGDHWCLQELLPAIGEETVRKVWQIVQNHQPEAVATDDLVQRLWKRTDDGGADYHLLSFALNAALSNYRELQYLLGAGWLPTEQWQAAAQRPVLVGPRQRNIVPAATDDAAEEQEMTQARPEAAAPDIAPDMEAWRQHRRSEVTLTLRASHYYSHWLPLNREMRQLFPPWPGQVTFYHRFGGVEEQFTALIHPEQKRIGGDRAMYEAFHQHGIYPGARLTISHRGTDYEYDIRTRPHDGDQLITVRRVAFDENGELDYWEDEEPIQYEVDGDLFIASARWEDLPALFQQAEEVGQGIFGLMFAKCQQWQQERSDPLIVTAADLFEAIHFESRLTSKATIAYELWRRQAFEAQGNGRYQFNAAKGDRTRNHGLTGRRARPTPQPPDQRQSTRSLPVVQPQTAPPPTDSSKAIQPPDDDQTQLATESSDQPPPKTVTDEPTAKDKETAVSPTLSPKHRQYLEQVWQALAKQVNQSFVTWGQERSFHISSVSDTHLHLRDDETGYAYQIERSAVIELAAYLVQHRRISRDLLRTQFAHARPQFLTAILATLPGITAIVDNEATARATDEFEQLSQTVSAQLIGADIITPGGSRNRIVKTTESGLIVRSSKGEAEVKWIWIKQVYDKLRLLGTIERADVQKGEHRVAGGFRSAFIFGLLARFDHITVQVQPRARLVYTRPVDQMTLQPVGFSPSTAATEPQITPSHPDRPEPEAKQSLATPTPIKQYFRPRPDTGKLGNDMTKTNKSLFAAHYLAHRLPDHAEWQADPGEALAALQELYQRTKHLLPKYNEAQTEDEFVKPVLDILGFATTVQTSLNRAGRSQRPDYTLFATARQKAEADQYLKEEAAFYDRAVAIAEAKYWERSLTVQHADSGRAQFDNRNPSFQIVNYLTGTGVDWGILTNGRIWRLYYRQASSTATEFYEVDLVELLESGDPDAFKRFWLFFRKEAFVPGRHGVSFLDAVRQGSATYARKVSDQLKERVFDEVFPLLAGGFVADMARRGQDPDSEANKSLIYEATLSLLYKLLFLLYGEARDLLPTDHPGYWRESLTNMAQSVAQRLDRAESLGSTATTYYRRLRSLFEVIDQGDPGLGLPRYNGGLFHFDFSRADARQKHRANYFLTQYAINDVRLAQAMDLLARIDGEPVDYSFLEVRHLGAVYEGLLEYRLVIEEAAAGRVHLATDKGERKATGSYYTPDYIVKYIVHHTLDPILQARAERFGQLMAAIVPGRERLAELESRLANSEAPPAANVVARYRNEAQLLRRDLAGQEKEARDTLLDIKVCDPAMGSGHFLVEAVDYLTDRLIQILNQYPDHNPILTQLETIRQAILANMAEQGIGIEAARLDDTQLLQRAVMKRCIYGVDLNRMAVELAKVSLWLHSFTIGAPLSFLDHHLRWGNSLIGASAREAEQELAEKSGQMGLFGGPFKGLLRAAEVMRGISGLSDATLAEVEQSEALFREFDAAAHPYKQLLDLRVAQHFGVKRAAEFLTLYGVDTIKAGPDSVEPLYAAALQEAQQLFEEKRFFHWELEFPEVFIDLDHADWKTNPGFDVVVGNPPWGGKIDRITYAFLKQRYAEVHQRLPDTAKYFFGCANVNLNTSGGIGQIVPNVFLYAHEYTKLRKLLFEIYNVRVLINLGDNVFKRVTTPCCIVIGHKSNEAINSDLRIIDLRHISRDLLPELPEENALRTNQSLLGTIPGHVVVNDLDGLELLLKLYKISDRVIDLADEISLGVHSGANKAFVLTSEEVEKKHIEKEVAWSLLTGSDIDRYSTPKKPPNQVLYLEWDTDITPYPNTLSHLQDYKSKLMARREAKQGKMPWYALHWARNRGLYKSPKVLCRQTSDSLVVTVDPYDHCALNSIIVIRPNSSDWSEFFWAAILNSKLIGYVYHLLVQEDNRTFAEVKPVNLRKLPIRHIKFETPNEQRQRLIKAFEKVFSEDQTILLRMTKQQLENGKLDVVHDFLSILGKRNFDIHTKTHDEKEGFLHWLVEYAGLPLADWDLKTVVQSYYEAGWDEFKRALNRNARAIEQAAGIDVKGRQALGRIKREYEASMATLTPLLARIEATDSLIDQIVYKLYGLTDEEIAIVEGKA